MKLLHIDASITSKSSVSRQLSGAVVAAFTRVLPGLEIIRRDPAWAGITRSSDAVRQAAVPSVVTPFATRREA